MGMIKIDESNKMMASWLMGLYNLQRYYLYAVVLKSINFIMLFDSKML